MNALFMHTHLYLGCMCFHLTNTDNHSSTMLGWFSVDCVWIVFFKISSKIACSHYSFVTYVLKSRWVLSKLDTCFMWFLARVILRLWSWRWHVPPEHQLNFSRLCSIISQKVGLFEHNIKNLWRKRETPLFALKIANTWHISF